MFGISGTELFLILLFAFLIFGPDKLPKIGRMIGRAVRQFRNAQDEMNRVIKTEVYDPIMDDEPLKNPVDIISGKKDASKKPTVKTVPSSSETFAERRARLARERAEQAAGADGAPVKAAAETAAGTAGASASVKADKPGAQSSDSRPKAETFAERRARLERERAAREAAAGVPQAKSAPVPTQGGDEAGKA